MLFENLNNGIFLVKRHYVLGKNVEASSNIFCAQRLYKCMFSPVPSERWELSIFENFEIENRRDTLNKGVGRKNSRGVTRKNKTEK